jgi:hypothetical protein
MRIVGFILFLVSSILKIVLSPILYSYGVIVSIKRKELDSWHKQLALSKDQYGNALGKYIFNRFLITKDSNHKFGNIDETISSVIGKNKKENTLTRTGICLDRLLDFFDSNHSIKSIDLTE